VACNRQTTNQGAQEMNKPMTAKQQARKMIQGALMALGNDFSERIEDVEFMRGKEFTPKQSAEIERHFDNYIERLDKVVW
jgi:hypothetical protein